MQGLFHYTKFGLYYLLALAGIGFLLHGGNWIYWGYLWFLSSVVLGDLVLGDDTSTPEYDHPQWMTWQLWLALPLTALLLLTGLWLVAPTDIGQIGTTLQQTTGYDYLAAKQSMTTAQLLVAGLFVGLMLSGIATVPAHELVHRTGDRVSVCIGRWLLAFSFDANFSIEHVFGHHLNVATGKDPASAPRGRNVYSHIIKSTIFGNISAWRIETRRLQRKGINNYSWHNACLRGYVMSVVLLAISAALAGWQGMLFFIFTGLGAKSLLEIVNYMEHYGLVRSPTRPVRPRHSWNTNRRFSSWTLFNLTRHSHHHASAATPYQKLRPYPEAPKMINGYLGTILLTLIPALWFKLMAPRLAHWDTHFASEREKALLKKL